MGFRFRRRIGPKGLKLNITKNGISSVSLGGRGLSYNIPVGRKGGARTTVGIPGTGLSWDYQEPGTKRTSGSRVSAQAAAAQPADDAYWAEHALWEARVAELSVKSLRPVPARPDAALKELTTEGIDEVLEKMPLIADEALLNAYFQKFGDKLQAFIDENGIEESNWRHKYLEDFFKWMQVDAARRIKLEAAKADKPKSPQGIKQLSPEQQKREWLIALWVIGVGGALTMALAGAVSTVQRPSRPSVNPTGWNAQQAIEAKAKREVAAFKRRQEEEKERQEKREARSRAGNAMRAAGYWLGPGGGCLTWNSKGNKKYVSRSICRSFFSAEGVEL